MPKSPLRWATFSGSHALVYMIYELLLPAQLLFYPYSLVLCQHR